MIGARIKQARLLAETTQQELANRLSERGYPITAAAISKYENSKSYPPAQFMILASSELNINSNYFSHQPAKSIQWKSFRKHSKLGKTRQESIKANAADIAELHIELHSLLYPNRTPRLPAQANVMSFEEAEAVANQLREFWELGNRSLDNLIQTVECRGVIVIGWNKSEQFDGLSGWCDGYPVIVINTNRSSDRIRFSLAHEIGHLVMDTANVDAKLEEKLANRFASAFLVPAEHARNELGNKRVRLDWGELMMLKRKYGLSMAAWVTRARDLGIISQNRHTAIFIELGKNGWKTREPVEYQGDEEPLQLKQMAHRAVADGLMSPDRISRVGIEFLEIFRESAESTHLTVRDLLAMPASERQAVMKQAFALAAEEDFEIFEAGEIFDYYDVYNEDYDAEAISEAK